MVVDHLAEYGSVYLACKAIGGEGRGRGESLRRWVNQALVDTGEQPGTTTSEKARIKELEREVRDLQEANEILKAASIFFAGELDPRHPMIIEFIDAQRRCGHRILAVCQVLGTLGVVFSDRAYRKARTRQPAARACADAVVVEALLSTRRPDPKTQRPPRERFYGRRKMTHWLRRKGLTVSYCQVDRLMRQERLHGLRRGRIKATTRRDDTHTPATDLVARNFTAAIPDQLWIAGSAV